MEIRLEHLSKVFADKHQKAVTAVNDLDIVIPSGKLVGLLGPSGCGKSTTLYMISGLLKPTEGRIWFGDEDVTEMAPEKRGIGLVFQNYALYPHLTVRQNIQFPLENLKWSKEDIAVAVEEAARLVQLEEMLDRKPSQLSGGQQQRVAIARALVKKPRVLLLDEPLSNLDARLRLQTREEIKRIQKETGVTTIFVTHDQEEAMSISDEIVVMNFGVKQQTDVPQTVYEDPCNLFVAKFLGTPPIDVFTGEIRSGKVFIGEQIIMDAISENGETIPDQQIYVGVRPEAFVPNPNGCFTVDLEYVEKIGRDMSIVAKHKACEKANFRIVVDSDSIIDDTQPQISFDLKPRKTYLFNRETEERLK